MEWTVFRNNLRSRERHVRNNRQGFFHREADEKSLVYWNTGQEVIFDGVDLDYTIDDVFEDNTGFYALGLISDLHGPALVLRGTEPWKDGLIDLWSDFDPDGIGYDQFDANWGDVSVWLSDKELEGQPADIVGHSLGGALAQWIAAEFTADGKKIDEVVTFNSPGISRVSADSFMPDKAGSVTHYIVNGDVVSMAGEAYIPGTVNMASFRDIPSLTNPAGMWDLDKHVLPLLESEVLKAGTTEHRQRATDLTWDYSYTTSDLNAPLFSYTDLDYYRWLLELQLVTLSLSVSVPVTNPLTTIPAALVFRGTTEASREFIGGGLHAAYEIGVWTVDAAENLVLELGERAHDLFEQLPITINENFELTVDNGDPPMLRFDGDLGISLGDDISIDLPSWLGGPFAADYLIDLVELDANGLMDRDHLEVNGQLEVFGGLLTIDGMAALDWDRGELTLSGNANALDGFITAASTIRVGSDLDMVANGNATVRFPDSIPWVGGCEIVGGQFLMNYVHDDSLTNDYVVGWASIGPLRAGLKVRFDGEAEILLGNKLDALAQQAAQPAAERLQVTAERLQDSVPHVKSYQVESETDWVLFAAKWENSSSSARLTLQPPGGEPLAVAEIVADPSMVIVEELTNDRQVLIRVEQPDPGTWSVSVSDSVDLGAVDIVAFIDNASPSVSWRLTGSTSTVGTPPVSPLASTTSTR